MIWPNGSRYTGQWRNGMKHGEGSYISRYGYTLKGSWNRDRYLEQ